MTNVVRNIWEHAESTPEHIALRADDQAWSYAELQANVARAALGLKDRGVNRGDRVLMVVPSSAEFVFVYYGILSIGATAVTVNTLCTAPEIEYYLSDAQCTLAVGYDDTSDALSVAAARVTTPTWILSPGSVARDVTDETGGLPEYVDLDDNDSAAILYTSGTTGRPKGAVLSHRNLISTAQAASIGLEVGPDDRMGTALPLFHVFGQVSAMGAIHYVGGGLSLLRRFDAEAMLKLAVSHRLTAMAGVPTMWNEMLHAETSYTPADLAGLRLCLCGGAPLPTAVKDAFLARFGAHMVDGYGLTETSAAATCGSVHHQTKEGSVGRAVHGTRIAILDNDLQPAPLGEVGQVAVDGPGVMREYWKRPEATASVRSGPWFLTGDLGTMDADGDLWIVGRLKDLIIRGGYNVYPTEIEDVLYRHPSILECAVVGVPDDRLGEEVAAVLVPQQGSDIDLVELREWLAERLAAYKVPRIFQLSEGLPKGTTGKILKREIDQQDLLSDGVRPPKPART